MDKIVLHADGMNSKIMSIKRRLGGFRNRQNSKTAIFYYRGGLSLYPQYSGFPQCQSAIESPNAIALFTRW